MIIISNGKVIDLYNGIKYTDIVPIKKINSSESKSYSLEFSCKPYKNKLIDEIINKGK